MGGQNELMSKQEKKKGSKRKDILKKLQEIYNSPELGTIPSS